MTSQRMPLIKRLLTHWLVRCGFRRFRKSADGTLTVEMVIWLPLVFLTVALIVDASMMFQGHTEATRVLQDANRNMSVGRAGSLIVKTDATLEAARVRLLKTNTETYVRNRLNSLSPNATVATTITANVATTEVKMPASDLTMIGLVSAFTSTLVVVKSQLYLEM